jgi:hypothetical protein
MTNKTKTNGNVTTTYELNDDAINGRGERVWTVTATVATPERTRTYAQRFDNEAEARNWIRWS